MATKKRSSRKAGTSALRGARIERSAAYNTPNRIYDIETPASKRDPKKIADDYLKQIAATLKVDPSDLKFDKIKESILGSHVLYQQYHEGMPISRAWLRIDVGSDGKVFQVMNDLVSAPYVEKSRLNAAMRTASDDAKTLTSDEADARALESVRNTEGAEKSVAEHELLYYPINDVPVLCWKVIVKTDKPAGAWKIYVDAHNGTLLERFDLLRRAVGKGRVFDPNPVVVLNDTTLKDKSKIPAKAYRDVVLQALDGKGSLDGEFVSTRATRHRVRSKKLEFVFSREERAFKEVMVYFHIDRLRRHLHDLGFTDVMNHAIEVNIDGETDDNSQYDPVSKSLTFGTGGVDDAEDAEIILHEYGHAIQDDQVPGFGEGKETGAMGEGFGDFLAASSFADVKPAPMRPTIGNWDAVAYSGDEPPALRRLDSNKLYPKDIKNEVHADGEIWSACLWQLRAEVGRRIAETLVIAHHSLLSRTSTFEDAANALMTTDKQLNGGKNVEIIRGIFVRRGILPNPAREGRRAGVPFSGIVPRAAAIALIFLCAAALPLAT
jgi:Zn-dependent metalloprotease